jgi:hypothetical protein
MNATAEMRMPLLDLAFHLMDSVRSPQDFALIFHFRDPPDVDGLLAGARSAMNRFPKSAACIEGRKWITGDHTQFKLDCTSTLEAFVDQPFDLRHQSPIKQALMVDGCGTRLVSRFHHAAADGLSAALWLGHQLNVAYGLEAVERERAPFAEVTLRRLSTSVRRSQFAFDKASDPLWTSSSERSGSRRWLTIGFPASDLQNACRRIGGFTYNDLLAACTLEVFSHWNSSCRGGTPWPPARDNSNIGLWLPLNIRSESRLGFGNGTSRVRLYARYNTDASFVEKCREVRRQVSWTTKHGEWVVPDIALLTRLPPLLTRPLLRGYLNRPSVDMATGVFSHAASWIANAGEAFKHVEKIESVGLLHSRQNLAINAATHAGQTWLTFTYDQQQWSIDDVRQLAEMYAQQIALAQRELI